MPGDPTAAVVADEWPLVRLGVGQALRPLEVRVVAETASGLDAARRATELRAGWLVVGTVRDAPLADVVRRARSAEEPPRVVLLLDHVGRDELVALLTLGADAAVARSGTGPELADALRQVAKGERAVGPALLPLLVGAVAPPPDTAGPLTRKEVEVLTWLAQGRSNKEIAEGLYVTPATVKSHLTHIYAKLGVASRQEAIARAVEMGLLA